jgi:hypothetical protein
MTEAQIERQCSDFLALDGWRLVKTDPCSDPRRGKGFGEKGMPDCLYLRYCAQSPMGSHVLWIEWKGPRGRVAPHQALWHFTERARGALVVVATKDFPPTFEGFTAWYRKSGLLRRQGL